jgi:hypothetical protein
MIRRSLPIQAGAQMAGDDKENIDADAAFAKAGHAAVEQRHGAGGYGLQSPISGRYFGDTD